METNPIAAILDTDVLVDVLRGLPAARQWLESIDCDKLGVPIVVAMELVTGCRNAAELQRCLKLVNSFRLLLIDQTESEAAFEYLRSYWLSDSLGISDALVAASAAKRSVRLYSFNVRHFRAVPGLDVQSPYERTVN